jgi:adenosine deaminase
MVLKAELHCHIEGAASPDLVSSQARKYGVDVSHFVRDGAFVWHDFTSFLDAYDGAAGLFRDEGDYARLAEHYLSSLARQGAIYSEFFTSPDHAERAGLSPAAYTAGLAEGIRRAKAKTGIEGRMIVTGVRHFGVESVEAAARFAARCGEPLVTGFGMGGDERFGGMAKGDRVLPDPALGPALVDHRDSRGCARSISHSAGGEPPSDEHEPEDRSRHDTSDHRSTKSRYNRPHRPATDHTHSQSPFSVTVDPATKGRRPQTR